MAISRADLELIAVDLESGDMTPRTRIKLAMSRIKAHLREPGPGALAPGAALLSKLGSIVVHIEEARSVEGHHYDWVSLDLLLADPEVKEWLAQMDAMAMLPKKRSDRG